MSALTVVPTTDSIQGWLIVAMLAVALVCAGAGASALWDTARRHRLAFDRELQAAVDDGTRCVNVRTLDHHLVTVRTDRRLTLEDVQAITQLHRALREQLEGETVPSWMLGDRA